MKLRSTPIGTFLGCPRKYQLAFEMGVESVEKSSVLSFGSAFHAALEVRAKGGGLSDARKALSNFGGEAKLSENMSAVGDALLVLYYEAYRSENLRYVGVEQPWEFSIDGIDLAGRFDAVAEINGETWIVEHKTTSSDIEAGSKYWQARDLNLQVDLYMLAAEVTGMNVAGVLYDVVRRPQLAIRRATPVSKRKYRKDGVIYKGQRETDETANEYQARILDYVVENRDNLLRRESFYFDRRATDRCKSNILQVAKLIGTGARPMNTGNCYAFNQECQYKPVCAGETSTANERLYKINPNPLEY